MCSNGFQCYWTVSERFWHRVEDGAKLHNAYIDLHTKYEFDYIYYVIWNETWYSFSIYSTILYNWDREMIVCTHHWLLWHLWICLLYVGLCAISIPTFRLYMFVVTLPVCNVLVKGTGVPNHDDIYAYLIWHLHSLLVKCTSDQTYYYVHKYLLWHLYFA